MTSTCTGLRASAATVNKNRFAVALAAVAVMLWALLPMTTSVAYAQTTASVWTDQPDYAPGATAIITGAGFWPNEVVTLHVEHADDTEPGGGGHEPWTVTADAQGGFTTTWYVDPDDSAYSTFLLTAVGADSGLTAQWTFTDLAIGTYDQCSNDDGDGYASGDTGCRWINGNLQSNNSTYFEGDATVQRVWLTDFVPGSSHTVTLKYGTTKGGKHAYDFLTTWDWSENWIDLADRCQDITGCTTAAETYYDIPQDGNVPDSFEPSAPGDRQFVMRGGTLTGSTSPVVVSGSYAGDSETVITVSFTVANSGDMCVTKQGTTTCAVALWFGAHVAAQANWGLGQGAGSIPGSPYHVALDAIDGLAVGQRDNQMQANAVTIIPNGTIVIIKDAQPNDAQDFSFNLNNASTISQDFSLDDDADVTLPNSQTFSVPPGSWSASEILPLPAGWSLVSITCVVNAGGTSTFAVNLGTGSAAIELDSNDTVTCTFVDTKDLCLNVSCSDTVCANFECNPANGQCEVFSYSPSDTVCNAAAGVCDVAEYCTGSSADCPADGDNLTTECRASAGVCDVAEYCSNASDDCPADDFVDAGTECSASTGVCDVAEYCTGSSADCPADGDNLTTECRASAGVCDVAEFCSNADDDCPDDGKSVELCRPQDGVCDIAEYCNGTDDACPPDGFEPPTTACGDGTDTECDNPDHCSGIDGSCVPDYEGTNTICREAVGECDVTEYCDGSGNCPGDGFEPPDTPCGDPSDTVCTNPDTCDGDGVCDENNEACSFVTNSALCPFDAEPDAGVCVNDSDGSIGGCCSLSGLGGADYACDPGWTCEPGRDFRNIFTPDVKQWVSHKLNASNPGQFFYNLIAEGDPNDTVTLTINIPWPFITVGAVPVHVYDGVVPMDANGCFDPQDVVGRADAQIRLTDWAGSTSYPGVTCDVNLGPDNGDGKFCTFDVVATYPASGKLYVNVHLDYGLKGGGVDANPVDGIADRYEPGGTQSPWGTWDAHVNQADDTTLGDGALAIPDCQDYAFSHDEVDSDGPDSFSDEVHSLNEFKRIAGAIGLAVSSLDGEAAPAGTSVTLKKKSTNTVVQSSTTDEDGFFFLTYAHKGTPAVYTVTLGGPYNLSVDVTLNSNGWSSVEWDIATGTARIEQGYKGGGAKKK